MSLCISVKLNQTVLAADKVTYLPLKGNCSKATRTASDLLYKLSNIKHCIINLYLKSVIWFTGYGFRKHIHLTKPFFWYPLGSATQFRFCKTQSHVQLVEIDSDINTIKPGLQRFYASESKNQQ